MNKQDLHFVCLDIVDSGMGYDAIKHLSKMLSVKEIQLQLDHWDALNSLATIRKINNGKDEAIDALCER